MSASGSPSTPSRSARLPTSSVPVRCPTREHSAAVFVVATTRTAAECARVAHLTGTLEVGKRADLLGVDGDPLADIRVLQHKDKLSLIMRDGQVFKSPSTRAAPAAP